MSMQSGDAWVCSRRMGKRREDGWGVPRRDAEGAVGRCGAPRVVCASRSNALCPATPRRGIRRGDGYGAFVSDVDPSDGNVARVSPRNCAGPGTGLPTRPPRSGAPQDGSSHAAISSWRSWGSDRQGEPPCMQGVLRASGPRVRGPPGIDTCRRAQGLRPMGSAPLHPRPAQSGSGPASGGSVPG